MDRSPVLIDLALQGGGSHGAFTWGVLDRLLDEPWFQIAGISGTSAGAMNAAVLVDGWAAGGADGARAALDKYWRSVSRAAAFSPLQRSPLDRILGRWSLDTSPAYLFTDLMSRVLSPYDLNPLGFNPLRDILADSIDFGRLARAPIRLFVTATRVRTGRGRIFRNAEITADVLLASACLPTMFPAIEIDGEPYWDGGYVGNPTITPLVRETDAQDTVFVQINPTERAELPRSAAEILNRLNEISFNSALAKELRMIALLRQVADPGTGEGARWAQMKTHRIKSDLLAAFGASSKLNAEWAFVAKLRDEGRRAAGAFIDAHGADLGARSTADLDILLAEC
ncbi:patatin-like phospholipase family protein [Bradyrhizobium sp. U87765 SZCCT0131]|uniref:patatin-like phospholipase family protein n=1 Tax=unclassified Bradyrhizobium TaxID=2631580 RepID=UPI001BA57849|nr:MULTISPECIES: patatin-like phospholipase family protein [unclassified Bradyrhizobium]MBR1220946.1 patatin-like phospholipase family protein [Bradyrhizobium sp. U87765 SZCCT0131]MBR1260234.1 patatin-like phospholipase family protein [Bradyrhizobium sp. U87765 SZCCT0134]MBR1307517.1 patatin-like phospholipase family protein [Bradyrhizobium sp. U87765 SZCCT0110]MBR1321471.1 patatin-like phospholipase family protein [Bradyrhizobium sp. U87765 SZCCT0109]MBR1349784.1 patatin-like phospholipase fa